MKQKKGKLTKKELNKMLKNYQPLRSFDLSRLIADHLVGENHKPYHRYIIGVLIMWSGVSIMQIAYSFHVVFTDMLGDLVGYAIHGLGAVPFVEGVLRNARQQNLENKNNNKNL